MSHARLSPSASARWMRCPGSVREEAKYPDPPSSAAAVDGTHSHTLLEHCLEKNLTTADGYIGQELADHEGRFSIDKERAARINMALDYIYAKKAEMESAHGLVQLIPEQRVNPGILLDRDDLTGTADVQLISDDLIEIIDYKDGVGEVIAEYNTQLMLYALGALGDRQPMNVVLTIIQPKLADRGSQAISSYEMTLDQLMGKVTEFRIAAAKTDDPNAELVPGEKQCHWCKAKGNCKALAEKTLNDIGLMFGSVEMVDQLHDTDENEIPDDQLRQIIEAAPLLKELLKSVEAEAKRRFSIGHNINGLKAVRGRGTRRWAMPEDEMVERLKKLGIPKAACFQTKMLSPAQVEKLTWEKRDGTKKKLSDRQIETLKKEYIQHDEGELKIVPENDSREAIELGAASLFSAVDTLPDWMK